MTMTAQTTISCALCSPPTVPRNQSFALRSRGFAAMPRCSFRHCDRFLAGDRRLRSLRTSRCFLMDVVVRSSVEPAGHLPSSGAPGSWMWWILGLVVSVVLPFSKSKWGPLLKLKNEVDKVVEVAEEVTEVVEKVAEGVEKVAEDMAEVLPEGGKLRGAAEFVERVAEETAKDARLVEGLIDKEEELEKEVEEGLESFLQRPDTNQPAAGAGGGDAVAKEVDEPTSSV